MNQTPFSRDAESSERSAIGAIASPIGANVSVESLVGQIAGEFTERLNRGERPDIEEYATRYPEIAGLLRQALPALEAVDLLTPGFASDLESELSPHQITGVLGDFRIIREVGRGGMGVVYEAEQISLGRRVALKILPFAATLDPRQLQRFQNEARAAASLEHPHIVPIYGVGHERGVHYYAMKFIDGQSLAELIQPRPDLASGASHRPGPEASELAPSPASGVASAPRVKHPPNLAALTQLPSPETAVAIHTEPAPPTAPTYRQIADWGIQAALALEHAHSLGIVHRDIKPANLMIETHSPSPLGGEGPGVRRTRPPTWDGIKIRPTGSQPRTSATPHTYRRAGLR